MAPTDFYKSMVPQSTSSIYSTGVLVRSVFHIDGMYLFTLFQGPFKKQQRPNAKLQVDPRMHSNTEATQNGKQILQCVWWIDCTITIRLSLKFFMLKS
jgi:hypothetical protein